MDYYRHTTHEVGYIEEKKNNYGMSSRAKGKEEHEWDSERLLSRGGLPDYWINMSQRILSGIGRLMNLPKQWQTIKIAYLNRSTEYGHMMCTKIDKYVSILINLYGYLFC